MLRTLIADIQHWTQLRRTLERRSAVGDKGGKKDKDKDQKQKASEHDKEAKRKLEKQPKRTK